MNIILTKEQKVMTNRGEYQLIYELLMSQFSPEEGEGKFFGIRIRQYLEEEKRMVDDRMVPGVTENLEEAKVLFFQFVEGKVMPVHLTELLDDWQSAFHPRMERKRN